jgi:hypothetical protein
VLVIEGCEHDPTVGAGAAPTSTGRRVFGVGGLDLSHVVSGQAASPRVVVADLFDEAGQVRRECSVVVQ